MRSPTPSAPATSPPPLLQQGWNLAQSLAQFAANPQTVTPADYRVRLKICDGCPSRDGSRCNRCGCNLAAKARGATFHCPDHKWPNDPATPRRRVKILFPHGLGDHVQLTAFLAHAARYRPWIEWTLDPRPGCESLFASAFSLHLLRLHSDLTTWLPQPPHAPTGFAGFGDPLTTYADSPSTKAAAAIRDHLGIVPDPELLRYSVPFTPAEIDAAAAYLDSIDARDNCVLIHAHGTSLPHRKNLSPASIAAAQAAATAAGCVPLLLDFSHRAPLAPLFPTDRAPSCTQLAALASLARLNIGIDSGPGKVFEAAAPANTIIVWRSLHPLHFSDLNPGVLHLVPQSHAQLIRHDQTAGLNYFHQHYQHRTYEHLPADLAATIRERLSG